MSDWFHEKWGGQVKTTRNNVSLEELEKVLNQFVDEQIGKESANGVITFAGDTIKIVSKGSMNVEDWKEMGLELIELLEVKNLGCYEITGCGRHGIRFDLCDEDYYMV